MCKTDYGGGGGGKNCPKSDNVIYERPLNEDKEYLTSELTFYYFRLCYRVVPV